MIKKGLIYAKLISDFKTYFIIKYTIAVKKTKKNKRYRREPDYPLQKNMQKWDQY